MTKPPDRVRNPRSYRDGQPDLDVFNDCFKGFASPRFCGTDLDGLFAVSEVVHGVWERRGYHLVQEHKSAPGSWGEAFGQWLALNQLGVTGRGFGHLIYKGLTKELGTGTETSGRIARVIRSFQPDNRICVVVTYGDPNRPHAFHRLPLVDFNKRDEKPWTREPTPMDLADPESTPHRQWIRWVSKRAIARVVP